jgi:hypothetical protein
MSDDERWYRWLPDRAGDAAFADIAAAVEDFESVDTESGRAATEWLKQESLANHPYTLTWLLVEEGRVEAYYAICSAEITLTERQRRQLPVHDRAHRLHPRQGASLIAWIAKHRDATVGGEFIALHAAYTATEVSKLQGNIALAVDPFDEGTSEFWQSQYGFRPAHVPEFGHRRRLWLPLHEVD